MHVIANVLCVKQLAKNQIKIFTMPKEYVDRFIN